MVLAFGHLEIYGLSGVVACDWRELEIFGMGEVLRPAIGQLLISGLG